MDEASTRLHIQLALRPGPWIAVVHGDRETWSPRIEAVAARSGIRITEGAAGPDDLTVVVGDTVPTELVEPPSPLPPVGSGRLVLILPESARCTLAAPWLACRIGGPRPTVDLPAPLQGRPPGSTVDPLPLLSAATLPDLARGIAAMLDRGWYEDAGYFLERLRFLTYRAAAVTWDDRDALLAVVEAEELTGRLATGLGAWLEAWEAWRTAWWLRGEIVRDDEDRARLDLASRHIDALAELRAR